VSLASAGFCSKLLLMKTTEIQLLEPLYDKVLGLADRLHLSMSEVLCKAAEELVQQEIEISGAQNEGKWLFPEGKHLGVFVAKSEDWRMLANEGAE